MKNTARFSLFIVLAPLVWTFGCIAPAPRPDPLARFHFEDHNPDATIEKDYRDYIQKLPPDEGKYAGPIHYLTDGAGQHAIMIMMGIDNKVWRHILIYDKDDKRIKTIKYLSGDYHS